MSDAELLEWLCSNLRWDGFRYWLPELCVKERGAGQGGYLPPPTIDELRAAIAQRIEAKKQ